MHADMRVCREHEDMHCKPIYDACYSSLLAHRYTTTFHPEYAYKTAQQGVASSPLPTRGAVADSPAAAFECLQVRHTVVTGLAGVSCMCAACLPAGLERILPWAGGPPDPFV